jgi:WD40 repeat protein
MATLFLSHASHDDGLTRDLQAWLIAGGFDDLFVDHESIRGGDKWGDALRAAKASCRAVICLVTEHWLVSDDCFGEFLAAWYQGKRIIPLLAYSGSPLAEAEQRRLARVRAEDQGFDILPAIKDGKLALDSLPEMAELIRAGLRASGALAKVGLDPEAFEIDRASRPSPYPGLESFGDTDADAAIFYGRTPEILRSLEDLREMRANGSRQPYIILGASGSGKSSLLQAGILPRLRRERGWIVLRAFRPGADPLLNFCSAVIQTFNDVSMQISAGSLRDELQTAGEADRKVRPQDLQPADSQLGKLLKQTFDRLRARAGRAHATILMPLDQAEELVHATGQSADILADCLRALLTPPPVISPDMQSTPGVLLCLTIRTDSLPALQNSPRFTGFASRLSDVRPVPLYRFSAAIEGPAGRYGVAIETGLVEAMIDEAPGDDALPLLAFALQRLWKQYSSEKILRRLAYESLGKLSGMIKDAAERALRGLDPEDDAPVSAVVPADVEHMAARAFVPPLAQVTESGVAVRRVTELTKFDQRAIGLLDRFVAWRLLVKKSGPANSDATMEVAHEAIFRSWPRLQKWVDAEKARLQILRDVDDASSNWQQHNRRRAYLNHRGSRLKQARDLLKVEDFAIQLGACAKDYLQACRRAQLKRQVASGVGVAMLAVAAFAGYATYDTLAMQQAMRSKATALVRGGYPTAAAKFSVAGAIGDFDGTGFLSSDKGDGNLAETGFTLKLLIDLPTPYSVDKYVITNDGRRLIVKSADEIGSIWDIENRRKLTDLGDVRSVANFYLSQDQSRLITQSADNALAIWDVQSGKKIGAADSKIFKSAKMASVTSRMTTLSEDNTCTLWDLASGKPISTIGKEHETDWCTVSDTGTHLLTRSIRFAVTLWAATDGRRIADIGQGVMCYTCSFGSAANRISFIDPDGKASLFKMDSGDFVAALPDPDRLSGMAFSSNGTRLITRSVRNNLVLWDARSGERIASIGSSDADNYSFSPNGRQIFARSSNGSGELRDSDQGELLRAFPSASIKEYKFSTRGDRLATVTFNKAATLWNSTTGEKLADLGAEDEVETIVFSKDGTRMSVGSNTTRGALWDAAAAKKLTDFEDEEADSGGTFSADATRYVSLSPNNYATFWDAVSGKLVTSLGGEGASTDADVANDNRHVVTNSIASTASVWDADVRAERGGTRPSVRSQVCEMNYEFIGVFTEDQRNGDDDTTTALTSYIKGRPWHPCDWRGLLIMEGWAQQLRYWAVKVGFRWDYQCGERLAFGSIEAPATVCDQPDIDAIQAPKSSRNASKK